MKVSGVAQLVSNPDGKARLEVAGRPMFELNSVAAVIWEQLQAGLTPQEIVSKLVAQFDVSEQRAAEDVTRFVNLLTEHLLVFDDAEFTTR
jgi:hypothetical protein